MPGFKDWFVGFFAPQQSIDTTSTPSKSFRSELAPVRGEKDAFINHLYAALRNEKPPLYPLPGSASASAPEAAKSNHLTSFEQTDLQSVIDLFEGYQAYFEHYIAMHVKYDDTTAYDPWPTEDMDELNRLFASLQGLEAALSVELIEGTGLGVLEAATRYSNSFASMANDDNNFNFDKLNEAGGSLGAAQLATDEDFYASYFCGNSMTEVSRRDSCPQAEDLSSKLGSGSFLVIDRHGDPRVSKTSFPTSCAARAWQAKAIGANALSVIKMLKGNLDHSLRHEEARADENVSASQP